MLLGFAIIIIIVSIVLLIAVHEAGHAVIARYCGVRIHTIIIGFGRPLFQWKHLNRPTWTLALWPLGGSIELWNTRIRPVPPHEYTHCFDKKPIWMRIVILLAGASANLGIAWLALIFYFLLGYPQHPPVIHSVITPSIAATAHLQNGDVILSLADKRVTSWQGVGMQLMMHLGERHVPIIIQHNQGSQERAFLDLSHAIFTKRSPIFTTLGFIPDVSARYQQVEAGLSWFDALKQASITLCFLLHVYTIILKQVLIGNISLLCLLGPVGLFLTMVNSILQGVAIYLFCFANLSIAIALANLLPIPSLDGGSIIYALIEKIRGKPISVALEVLFHRLAMIGLCVLFVQLLANDLQHLIIF